MFIVYARYVNKTQPMRANPARLNLYYRICVLMFFLFFFPPQNIFIFYGCKVMFVLKETLESLISFSHALQELVQMG